MGGLGERFDVFIQNYGVGAVGVAVMLAAVLTVILLIRGPRLALVLLMLSYVTFFIGVHGIRTSVFFVRVFALVMLALFSMRRGVRPGWSAVPIWMYVIASVACIPFSPTPELSFQSGMLLLTTAIALTFGATSLVRSPSDIQWLLRVLLFAGVVWALVSIAFLGDFLTGGDLRFTAGGDQRATGYARVGALFMPFALWGVLQRESKFWRAAGAMSLVVIPICIFLSGTRTAILAGVIGMFPLLTRGGVSRTLRVGIVIGGLAVLGLFVGQWVLADYDLAFLWKRLLRTGLSGRDAMWSEGLRLCLQQPVIGRGSGASGMFAAYDALFHSAYIAVWYEAGIVGLGAILALLATQIGRAWGAMRRAEDVLVKDSMRLALGTLLSLAAQGVVENAFVSPSNDSVGLLFLMCVLVDRVRWMSATQPQIPQAVPTVPMLDPYPRHRLNWRV